MKVDILYNILIEKNFIIGIETTNIIWTGST